MNREYYFSTIIDFISTNPSSILGDLMVHVEFKSTDQQKNAWLKEISILQNQLTDYPEGEISFEYTIPRIGHRIDTICIIDGIIFLLEFKVGSSKYTKNADDQVTDYALDLKYFHEASKDRYLIPIVVATEGAVQPVSIQLMHDKIVVKKASPLLSPLHFPSYMMHLSHYPHGRMLGMPQRLPLSRQRRLCTGIILYMISRGMMLVLKI